MPYASVLGYHCGSSLGCIVSLEVPLFPLFFF